MAVKILFVHPEPDCHNRIINNLKERSNHQIVYFEHTGWTAKKLHCISQDIVIVGGEFKKREENSFDGKYIDTIALAQFANQQRVPLVLSYGRFVDEGLPFHGSIGAEGVKKLYTMRDLERTIKESLKDRRVNLSMICWRGPQVYQFPTP